MALNLTLKVIDIFLLEIANIVLSGQMRHGWKALRPEKCPALMKHSFHLKGLSSNLPR